MSWVMFRRAVKDLRWTVFWYGLGIALYSVLIIAYYPTFRDNSELFTQYMEKLPQGLIQAFGISDFGSFAGFVGGEFLNVMWPLIVSIFVIMAGAATVAQEIERGTIEFWLSVPESRSRLLWAKLGSLLTAIVALVLVTVGSLALGAAMIGETLPAKGVLAVALELTAFAFAIGGYAALFSSFSNERGRPAALAAGLTLAFYLLWVIAGMSESWHWLKYLSIFSAYKPQQALTDGQIPGLGIAVLVVVGLVCAASAVAIFQRRDAIS